VVYAHGGGMVLGTLDLYDEVISWYVAQTGVPFLPVGYRRAPDEAAGTTLSEDVFAGLTWLLDHASALGVDPARMAVMGDSGGGAPAAGAAIAYARNLARAGIPIELHVHPGSRTAGRDSPRTPVPPGGRWPIGPAPSHHCDRA
jgi:hypothetical protein